MSEIKEQHRPRIIVVGNEKGGSGKSTTSMHLIVSLLREGFSVGTIDLDARQGTLSRYIENRQHFVQTTKAQISVPEHRRVYRSAVEDNELSKQEDRQNLEQAMEELWDRDYLVFDTPGSDNYLSRLGHSYADILITPLNDSFLDMDMLAKIEVVDDDLKLTPSTYSQMVWEQRQQRAIQRKRPIDWVVMRNRLSHIDAKNKRDMGLLLEHLAKRLQFRLAPGFGERVIFRELFPKGLTLLDLDSEDAGISLSMSHVAARQEVRSLLQAIGLSGEMAIEHPETI
ncbi:AAA family ATPase [Kiloniella laminariae]|uniref:AAA family ATPase n=1 Tax=Kiloniella laminariae TaxID=454162 RepID=A0ABT4LHC4_9PROT|nr:division plane positioning ATPase MipZ [Kiloniella laminariae]MCZ4279402.1 AAA family ATPase [Kiloniella laminariae]